VASWQRYRFSEGQDVLGVARLESDESFQSTSCDAEPRFT
jgi:hypothetical protein